MTATFPPTSSPTFTPGVPAATPTPVVTTTTTTTTASGSAPKNNSPKKIFGMEVRALATVLGLTLFFVLAMAGVVISLRQRFAPEEVATPNAPTSQPSADVVKEATCTLSFVVEPDASPSPSPSVSPSPSPSVSPSPSPSVSPSPTPSAGTHTCNSQCTTNQQCSDVNSAYICTSEGRCRLESNTTNAECKPADTIKYVCNSECTNNDQCADANPNYICSDNRCRLQTNPGNNECRERTTVSVGCNDTCVTNSDCSNPDHICNDNKCRLASNPGSASCSNPPTTTTTTTPTQPELPAELPKTGPEDLGIWLKGGFAALAVGALLLILL